MHIPIPRGVQNDAKVARKAVRFAKNVLFEACFPRRRSLVCQFLDLYSDYLVYIPSFSVLTLWHTYAHSNNG